MPKDSVVIVNVTELMPYTWWQVKRHKAKGEAVFTCTIQDLEDVKTYYTGTDKDASKAVDLACKDAAAAKAAGAKK